MIELQRWSEIIRKQGEQTAAREQRELDGAKARLPAEIERVKALPSNELLDSFLAYSQSRFTDPRMTAVLQEVAQEAKAELLRRLP